MKPNDLDIEVAQKVMGYQWVVFRRPPYSGEPMRGLFSPDNLALTVGNVALREIWQPWDGVTEVAIALDGYRYVYRWSQDATLAMEVNQKITHMGLWLRLQSPFEPESHWFAGYTPIGVTGWNGAPDVQRWGTTAAEAICRAALAVMEDSGLLELAKAQREIYVKHHDY